MSPWSPRDPLQSPERSVRSPCQPDLPNQRMAPRWAGAPTVKREEPGSPTRSALPSRGCQLLIAYFEDNTRLRRWARIATEPGPGVAKSATIGTGCARSGPDWCRDAATPLKDIWKEVDAILRERRALP